ncbi:MAG: ABC transporter ATP-binding protein/permease [Chloroflexi bacterium]|nr:ABC transporter ATP-binding protein/permease [Chloroflexota bacterium]
MTIFVLLPLIAVILIVKWMTPRIRLYRQKNLEATEKVTSFIGDILGRIQTIKIASMENHVAQQFDFLNQIRRQAAVNDQVLTQLLNAIFVNVGNLGTGLVLVFASFAIQQGTFSIGDFAFFAFSLTQATRIAEVYGNTITKFQQSKASLHRMDRFMETEPPEKLVEHGSVYDKGEFPPVQYERKSAQSRLDKLEIRDLSYFSTNSPFKLENIHLCLERDTLTVITGRTGSGKSTLLRNIIGLLPMESGQIYWNNQLVEVPDTFFKPPKCAYIPQVPMLFSDSVKIISY